MTAFDFLYTPSVGPTLGDYVDGDDGEGSVEHRKWIAKRRKRAKKRSAA